MTAPSPSQRILPLLKDAFTPLGFFLAEIWQSVAPLAPDGLKEQLRETGLVNAHTTDNPKPSGG